jgi:MerR family transcriptional regulator/heat shock protein HspR
MTTSDPLRDEADPSQGVYGISVASGMVGTGVQNLRAYERAGLLNPDRTAGGTRLYSPDDVARLRRIQRLLSDGLNLTGIGRVLDLEDDLADARSELEQLGAVTRPPPPAPPEPGP